MVRYCSIAELAPLPDEDEQVSESHNTSDYRLCLSAGWQLGYLNKRPVSLHNPMKKPRYVRYKRARSQRTMCDVTSANLLTQCRWIDRRRTQDRITVGVGSIGTTQPPGPYSHNSKKTRTRPVIERRRHEYRGAECAYFRAPKAPISRAVASGMRNGEGTRESGHNRANFERET